MSLSSSIEMAPNLRVLVTGASGLIGRQVIALLKDQAEVVAVSRFAQTEGFGVRWIVADLTKSDVAARLVRDVAPEIIIHLAGAVRGDRTLDAVHPTFRANLGLTVELLEAGTRLGVDRIVVSGSLLEEPAGGDPSAVAPSPYGASRWASTMYSRMFHALFETPVVVLRPSYAYGPGQDATKLIPLVISAVLRGERPELASGERYMDFVYSKDVARAYISAAAARGVEGVTIDIGYGEMLEVRTVVDELLAILDVHTADPIYGAIADRPLEQEIQVDPEPARRLLGWTAETTLEEGLRATVEWYQERLRAQR